MVTVKNSESVLQAIREMAADLAAARSQRQGRREIDPSDFDRLREAGFQLMAVPAERGGLWHDPRRSSRRLAEMLRHLAGGDSSVALVASMHPAVIWSCGWLAPINAGEQAAEWEEQRRAVFQSITDRGCWWGTISSEPGSGGDSSKTQARAVPDGDGGWRLTGVKHFGSGTGLAGSMMTFAIPEGEASPDTFYMDMRGIPLDGSAGARVVAPWDGWGMAGTQSHGVEFRDFPCRRLAVRGVSAQLGALPSSPIGAAWAGIFLGIVETAVAAAETRLRGKRNDLRAYERVEWARVRMEAWLIEQAYEGMLRAVEGEAPAWSATMNGKVAISELAESCLGRLCKIVGGGSYSRNSPFGWWLEDVRALAFLRPPLPLAYDILHERGWSDQAATGLPQ